MGLWLKCPACQAKNTLDAKVCAACGQPLSNLPPEQRIYILERAGEEAGQAGSIAASLAAPPEPEKTPAPNAAAPLTTKGKGSKGSKRSKKKK